jgi:hypothetical protein
VPDVRISSTNPTHPPFVYFAFRQGLCVQPGVAPRTNNLYQRTPACRYSRSRSTAHCSHCENGNRNATHCSNTSQRATFITQKPELSYDNSSFKVAQRTPARRNSCSRPTANGSQCKNGNRKPTHRSKARQRATGCSRNHWFHKCKKSLCYPANLSSLLPCHHQAGHLVSAATASMRPHNLHSRYSISSACWLCPHARQSCRERLSQ